MLSEFITTHRDAIIARSRMKLSACARASANDLESGVPLFLTQLTDALRRESSDSSDVLECFGSTATRHGRELQALGFTVSQVVHDYGDICQAVTEVALEQKAPITVEEFKTLNGCLDTAIAEAVAEHARITSESRSIGEIERAGHTAHETRNLLTTAVIAFETLKLGTVAINSSIGTLLGRSLKGLVDLVETTLSETRLAANLQRREPVQVASFLGEIAVAGRLQAHDRALRFAMEPIDGALKIFADPQLLASAVMNLLNNALKYSRQGGRIVLRAYKTGRRVHIEVEDECGGIPDTQGDPFQPFGDRRGADRTGLGLGLSIARKAVQAQGGDIALSNMPGKGCVFVIDVPLIEDLAVAVH